MAPGTGETRLKHHCRVSETPADILVDVAGQHLPGDAEGEPTLDIDPAATAWLLTSTALVL